MYAMLAQDVGDGLQCRKFPLQFFLHDYDISNLDLTEKWH